VRDFEITEQEYHFVCFRCGCIIMIGERMLSLNVSVESPTEDDSVELSEATAISTLCSGCAAILLGQAIMHTPGLMMPLPERSTMTKEAYEWEDDISLN